MSRTLAERYSNLRMQTWAERAERNAQHEIGNWNELVAEVLELADAEYLEGPCPPGTGRIDQREASGMLGLPNCQRA